MGEVAYDARMDRAQPQPQSDGLLAALDMSLDMLESSIVRLQDKVRTITGPYSVPTEVRKEEEPLTPARERIVRLQGLTAALNDTTYRIDI